MGLLNEWISNNDFSSLKRIYAAPHGRINNKTLSIAAQGRQNLVFVAKTETGKVIGGYTGKVANGTNSSMLSSPNMFIFSLTLK